MYKNNYINAEWPPDIEGSQVLLNSKKNLKKKLNCYEWPPEHEIKIVKKKCYGLVEI